MPRRREVPKRVILPDPLYHNEEVAKFINVLMLAGKKAVAERKARRAERRCPRAAVSSVCVSDSRPSAATSASSADLASACAFQMSARGMPSASQRRRTSRS